MRPVYTPKNTNKLKIQVWTIALKAKRKFGHETFLIYGHKHGRYDFDQVWQIAHLVPKNYPMCTGSDIFKTVLTWLFQNGITLGIWVGKCSFYCQLTLKKNAKTAKKGGWLGIFNQVLRLQFKPIFWSVNSSLTNRTYILKTYYQSLL